MTRTLRTAPAVAAALLVLAGCTVGDDTTPEDGSSTGAAAAPGATTGEDEQPEGLSSEEISAELLDRGDALAEREPVATVEAEVPLTPADAVLTLDVIEVVATASGTVGCRCPACTGTTTRRRSPPTRRSRSSSS